MDINEMRAIVRRDLKDEEAGNYRWSNDELDRHISRAVKELSEAVPLPARALLPTTPGSRDIDISCLEERVNIEAVEYPVGRFPPSYQQFSLWGDIISLAVSEAPDGSNICIYYGRLHTLDNSGSTLPAATEARGAAGAAGYAALEQADFDINRSNAGGTGTAKDFESWGEERLKYFRSELRRLGRRNRIRSTNLYKSILPAASKKTDYGP